MWHDFLFYHLPRVESGEALRFMADSPREIAFNLAPFGIPFKLAKLGFGGFGWSQARLFGNAYTGILLVLAAVAGRRPGAPRYRFTVWLAILMLASLRSPYAAPFVLSTLVVLLVVLAAELRSRWGIAAFVAACALFTLSVSTHDPWTDILVSLVRTLALYAFLVWAALRKDASLPEASG